MRKHWMYQNICTVKIQRNQVKRKSKAILKSEIAKKSKEIRLVARFASSYATDNGNSACKSNSMELKTVNILLQDIKNLMKNKYELTRERACEAMGFYFGGRA